MSISDLEEEEEDNALVEWNEENKKCSVNKTLTIEFEIICPPTCRVIKNESNLY